MAEEAEVVAAKKISNNGRKTKKKTDFLLTLNSNFFLDQCMESTPIYKGWKRDFFFYWGQILTFDSTG